MSNTLFQHDAPHVCCFQLQENQYFKVMLQTKIRAHKWNTEKFDWQSPAFHLKWYVKNSPYRLCSLELQTAGKLQLVKGDITVDVLFRQYRRSVTSYPMLWLISLTAALELSGCQWQWWTYALFTEREKDGVHATGLTIFCNKDPTGNHDSPLSNQSS